MFQFVLLGWAGFGFLSLNPYPLHIMIEAELDIEAVNAIGMVVRAVIQQTHLIAVVAVIEQPAALNWVTGMLLGGVARLS